MADKDRSKKEIIIVDSITAIISAMAIEAIYPPFLPLVIMLKLASFFGISFVIITFSKYDKVFRNLGLKKGQAIPILKYKTKTPYSIIYHFTLPAGLCLQDFLDHEEAIQNFVAKDIKIAYTFKEIIIEEYNERMKHFYDFIPTDLDGYVPIVIGYNRKSELISCDLGNGEPHMLIAGQTGGGKSTAIRCILTTLILFTKVKLHLIDLKNGVELRLFSNSSNVSTFSRNINQTKEVLRQLDYEVDSRYDLFYKENVKDIAEYNKKHKKHELNYQLLVVDEFADLQGERELMALLENLGRKARACGIHIILSTQRPDAKVLTGAIKANIPTVLGLKTTNSTNSHIIIDDKGLEDLNGNGHGLFKRNGKLEEIQVPFISPDKVEELIKHTFVDKTYKEHYKGKQESVREESFNSFDDNIPTWSCDNNRKDKNNDKSNDSSNDTSKSNTLKDTIVDVDYKIVDVICPIKKDVKKDTIKKESNINKYSDCKMESANKYKSTCVVKYEKYDCQKSNTIKPIGESKNEISIINKGIPYSEKKNHIIVNNTHTHISNAIISSNIYSNKNDIQLYSKSNIQNVIQVDIQNSIQTNIQKPTTNKNNDFVEVEWL